MGTNKAHKNLAGERRQLRVVHLNHHPVAVAQQVKNPAVVPDVGSARVKGLHCGRGGSMGGLHVVVEFQNGRRYVQVFNRIPSYFFFA